MVSIILEIQKRNPALDLVRIIALFSVISVHFFLNNGFYGQTVIGKRMFIMTVMRSTFMICVPLFLVLTGYLMCHKDLSTKFYHGIRKTLGIYIISSVFCTLFKWFFLHQEHSPLVILADILGFNGSNYSWYINMYIGLFLLIPFLNLIYNNLPSKKGKQLLVLTLLLLTAAPSLLNIFNFHAAGWWLHPAISTQYTQIVPDWWKGIYPFTYYFIGCYLREYGFSLKVRTGLFAFLCFALLYGTFIYYRSHGLAYIPGDYDGWGALPIIILTVLIFGSLLKINLDYCSNLVKQILKRISDLCLGGYLLSYIFDQIFYPKLIAAVPFMPDRLNYYILIVLIVFICSLILSLVANLIYKTCLQLIRRIIAASKSHATTTH